MEKCMMNYKIIYSRECIKKIETLARRLSDSINGETYYGQMNTYLNSLRQEERLKGLFSNSVVSERVKSDASILEIGSGIGSSALIAKALTDGNVYGVEPAPGSYAFLLECIHEFQRCNMHLPYTALHCSGENIELEDETMDFIYSFEVLEHVQNPQKCIEEAYRLLKRGGCAYIATCNYDSFYEGHYRRFWNPFIGSTGNKKRFQRKGVSIEFFDQLNFITKKKLIDWCNEAGFKEIKFNPSFGEGYNDYHFEQIYPDSTKLPPVTADNPIWLHKAIESYRINNILTRFNREYKLYVLLTK